MVLASDVAGIERNAMILRDGVTYYVLAVQPEEVDGTLHLVLSKQIQ